jgi:hypothetical protein
LADQQRASPDLPDHFVPSPQATTAPGVAWTAATLASPPRRPVSRRVADALNPKTLSERPVLLAGLTALAFSTYSFPYSNQHSYFLHTIARWGDQPLLKDDWFYNATEPYLFFNYIHAIVGAFPALAPSIVLLLFFIILSLGFLSIYQLLEKGFNVPVWFSAAFLIVLCNPSATFLFEKFTAAPAFFLGGIANQSLLYPPPLYYQPSSLAWLYFPALWLVAQSRFSAACALSAFIALMHPIMLASSLFFFCALIITLWRDVSFGRLVLWSILSFSIVLPGLAYQIVSNYAFKPDEIALARHIMLDVRTPHETDIRAWFGTDDVIRLLLIGFGVAAATFRGLHRRRVVRLFLTFTMLSVVASAVTFATGNETMRLIQPWRTSLVYLPILALFSIWLVVASSASKLFRARIVQLLTTCAIAASMFSPIVTSYKLFVFQGYGEKRPIYERLGELRDEGTVLAHMPRSFDDVRLRAGVPIYVDFKSPAFTAGDLIEWDRRVRFVESIDFSQCDDTAARMRQEGIGFFLMDRVLDGEEMSEIESCQFEALLESGRYVVYRIDGR